MSTFDIFILVSAIIIFGSIFLSVFMWILIWFIKWVAEDWGW